MNMPPGKGVVSEINNIDICGCTPTKKNFGVSLTGSKMKGLKLWFVGELGCCYSFHVF